MVLVRICGYQPKVVKKKPVSSTSKRPWDKYECSTEFSAAGYRAFCSGQEETECRQGLFGIGLAVKETICRKSVYTHQSIDERLMSMRFELTGESVAVNLVIAYAPTEASLNTQMKEGFWEKLGHMAEQIPTKECLFVLVDANARTGKRMEGCGDGRAFGAYGRDRLNSNGKRLLVFASDNRLALTNTCFQRSQG